MTSVRLSEELEARLDAFVADHKEHSKSHYIKEAIEAYLDDMEDIEEARMRLFDSEATYISTDELLKDQDV